MADSADLSRHQDAAILALIRFLREGLNGAPEYGGDTELLRSCLGLMAAYMSKTCPTLTHALERAQKASLPSEMLDELMAATAKIGADCTSTVRCIGDLDAAGGNRAQIVRRSIAGAEHMNDAARALTQRIDRLLEALILPTGIAAFTLPFLFLHFANRVDVRRYSHIVEYHPLLARLVWEPELGPKPLGGIYGRRCARWFCLLR